MSTILLVDDEQDTLDLFSEVLNQMNHQILEAHDGNEALSIAHRVRPDLVVTDWMMPRMDGLELCHQLHADARLRDVPIILHSASGDPHEPGTRFVPKNFPMHQFESLVERVLASSHARQPVGQDVRATRPPCPERFPIQGEHRCTMAH